MSDGPVHRSIQVGRTPEELRAAMEGEATRAAATLVAALDQLLMEDADALEARIVFLLPGGIKVCFHAELTVLAE